MWTCPKCGEQLEEQFDRCWKCGTFRDEPLSQRSQNPDSMVLNSSQDALTANELQALRDHGDRHLFTSEREGGYFGFATMISPILIKIGHVVGIFVITIAGIIVMTKSNDIDQGALIWVGLGVVIVGNLIWRLICEAAILFFRMHEELIEHNLMLTLIEQHLRHRR